MAKASGSSCGGGEDQGERNRKGALHAAVVAVDAVMPPGATEGRCGFLCVAAGYSSGRFAVVIGTAARRGGSYRSDASFSSARIFMISSSSASSTPKLSADLDG
jgi:hypothetical protein